MEDELYNILEKYKDIIPAEAFEKLKEFQYYLGESEGWDEKITACHNECFPIMLKYKDQEPVIKEWADWWDGA